MDAFATLDDYESRYGMAGDPERVETRLLDASVLIAARADVSSIDADLLRMICCQMVHRSMDTGADTEIGAGVPFTQMSQTAGVYSVSYSVSNPYGELYLTKTEQKLLGIGKVRLGSADAWVHDWPEDSEDDAS